MTEIFIVGLLVLVTLVAAAEGDKWWRLWIGILIILMVINND